LSPEDFEVLEKAEPYSGKVVRLSRDKVRLPNGRISTLETVVHGPSTAIVPILPDGRILLLRQFRYAVRGYILEIPAGVVNPGEDPEACARRELEEETGLVAGRMEPLGDFMLAPGYCDERIHIYVAHDLTAGTQALEPSEVIHPAPFPLDRVLEMIRSGEITDAKSVIGVLLAFPGRP
jgi:ADP-ribose pyrophosphatase